MAKTVNRHASFAEEVVLRHTHSERFWVVRSGPKYKTVEEDITMQAYCVKCRAKREMADPVQVTMKNGKAATQGKCPVCGTKMFRIGK